MPHILPEYFASLEKVSGKDRLCEDIRFEPHQLTAFPVLDRSVGAKEIANRRIIDPPTILAFRL